MARLSRCIPPRTSARACKKVKTREICSHRPRNARLKTTIVLWFRFIPELKTTLERARTRILLIQTAGQTSNEKGETWRKVGRYNLLILIEL